MWLYTVLSFLADSIATLLKAKAAGADDAALRALATESAVTLAALAAQQEITLGKLEAKVPGFRRD